MSKENFTRLNGQIPSDVEIKRRKKHVEGIIVHYDAFSEVLQEIKDHHQLSTDSEESKGLFLKGHPGVGKSTILKRYTKMYPAYRQDNVIKKPVLYTAVPSGATPKTLASKILKDLGDPLFYKGTEIAMTHRLLSFLSEEMCNVEMIIIDEFQQLIDKDTTRVLQKASDWLKSFSEEAAIPIIICGMPESERIFEVNEQLDGRFCLRQEMRSLTYDNEEDIRLYRSFLNAIDNSMPFVDCAHFADPMLADKFFYATNGNQRYLKKILGEATKIALRSGQDSITENDLNLAYERFNVSNRRFAINPFLLDKFELEEAFEAEHKKKKKVRLN